MRKYPYSVEWNRRRMYKRIVGLISVLCLAIVPILGASGSYAKANQNQELTISGLSIRSVGTGTIKHEVTLSGTLRNNSLTTLRSPKIQLTTFGPLTSRTQVAQVNSGDLNGQGSATNITDALADIPSNSGSTWTLVFIGDDVLGKYAAGVFSLGVRMESNANVADAISVPWFYNSSHVAPTNVIFAIPLSILDPAEFGTTNGPTTDVLQDVASIDALTSARFANRISWIIDPEINHVLTQTALGVSQPVLMAKVAQQLATVSTTSAASPYGLADLGAMQRAKMQSGISASIVQPANGLPVIYQPTDGAIDKASSKALSRRNVVALVANSSLSTSRLNTLNAQALLHGQRALVFDVATSECLKSSDAALDVFDEKICVMSQIAMMTAESPSASRSVVVLAPLNWNIGSVHLDGLLAQFAQQNWVTLGSWSTLFAQTNSPANATSNSQTLSALPIALINNVKKIDSYTLRLQQAIADPVVESELNRVRLNGYSTRWRNYSIASRYVASNVDILRNINNQIVIQATNRITTSNAQSSIPITVANHSAYDIDIRVYLMSSASTRITSDGSDLTKIPHGQRVTVAVPITLNGTGAVKVTAVLRTADGMGIGTGAHLEIASSTFERLARALVVGAFALLIILAISNFIRRKSRRGEADLGDESVGE